MKTLGHYIVLGTAKSISEEKKESKGDRNTTWLLILKDRVKKKIKSFTSLTIRWLVKVSLILISSPFHMPLSRMRSACQASSLSHFPRDEKTHRSWVSC